ALAEGNATRLMWQSLQTLSSNAQTSMGAKFVALTARPLPVNLADGANNDLNALGLNAPYDWTSSFNPGASYRDGVIYAAHGDKGQYLAQFLAAARPNYPFRKVL